MPKISFKIRLMLFAEIYLIAISSLLGFFVWKEMRLLIREAHRKEAVSIASSVSALIEPDRHEKAQAENSKKSTSYKKIQTLFKKIMDANPDINDIYTAYVSQNGAWTYVVGGYPTHDENEDGIITENEKSVAIGETFETSSVPNIAKGLDGPVIEDQIYCSKRGCQLSSYAPVKDRFGQAMAVAVVNVKAQDVLDFEKNIRLIILTALGIIFISFPLVFAFIKFPAQKD